MVRLCNEWAAAMKTQPAATEAAAQAWVAALNSGDVDAALAFFKGETMFKFWNDTSQGEEQMRAMFDWLVGKETLYQITNCEWQGTGVTCDVTAVDGCIAASEVPGGVHGKLTLNAHEDGTLKSVVGVLLVAERKAYQTWLDAERAWAAAERADELAQAEGYSKPAGAMVVKLCKEYGESLKATPTAAKAPAATGDQLKVVQAYYAALNSGDVDAALALFTDDVKFRGHWYATGKEALRDVFDWLAGTEVKHGPPDCQMQNDRGYAPSPSVMPVLSVRRHRWPACEGRVSDPAGWQDPGGLGVAGRRWVGRLQRVEPCFSKLGGTESRRGNARIWRVQGVRPHARQTVQGVRGEPEVR